MTADELIGAKRANGPAAGLAKDPAERAGGAQGADRAAGKGGPAQAGPRAGSGRLGVFLCAAGAVCLVLFGLLSLARPAFAEQVSESSMVTLNGAGILIALFLLLMALGIVLILKNK